MTYAIAFCMDQDGDERGAIENTRSRFFAFYFYLHLYQNLLSGGAK
jgi:hypothetical protein